MALDAIGISATVKNTKKRVAKGNKKHHIRQSVRFFKE